MASIRCSVSWGAGRKMAHEKNRGEARSGKARERSLYQASLSSISLRRFFAAPLAGAPTNWTPGQGYGKWKWKTMSRFPLKFPLVFLSNINNTELCFVNLGNIFRFSLLFFFFRCFCGVVRTKWWNPVIRFKSRHYLFFAWCYSVTRYHRFCLF